jgi:hypothetical protein
LVDPNQREIGDGVPRFRDISYRSRVPTKNAFERAADYWVALAERVELEERKSIPLARTVIHSDRMPIVEYLFGVGAALFLGLVSLNAYLDERPDSAAKLSTAPTTASLLSAQPTKQGAR